MSIVTRNLRQDATYWAFLGSDGFGGYLFTPPVKIKVRWEEKRESFVTVEGEEEISNAIVYSAQDMQVDDFLFLGVSTALLPTLVSGSYKIRGYGTVSNLRNLTTQRKIIL